jgi:hypothetical protein
MLGVEKSAALKVKWGSPVGIAAVRLSVAVVCDA